MEKHVSFAGCWNITFFFGIIYNKYVMFLLLDFVIEKKGGRSNANVIMSERETLYLAVIYIVNVIQTD